MRRVEVRAETWPLKQPFVISGLTQMTAEVVVVRIEEDGVAGHGECERADAFDGAEPKVLDAIEALRPRLEAGLDRRQLAAAMPAGYARAAVDCALWDLDAKKAGVAAWRLAGLDEPAPLITAFTISLDKPEKMAREAGRNGHRPLLKLKLGGPGDVERVAAVREAAPGARLIADANESWGPEHLWDDLTELGRLGVELVEQPLPRGFDSALAQAPRPIPVCADESCRDRSSLPALRERYDFVNIKLDKAGGLTEALALAKAAEQEGLGLMVGCNVGTSLAMAPALLIAGRARFVDLDGPLLLARDREPAMTYEGSLVHPAPTALWG